MSHHPESGKAIIPVGLLLEREVGERKWSGHALAFRYCLSEGYRPSTVIRRVEQQVRARLKEDPSSLSEALHLKDLDRKLLLKVWETLYPSTRNTRRKVFVLEMETTIDTFPHNHITKG